MAQRMLTNDDLAAMPDDGLRRELLDGELILSPSPIARHHRLVPRLIFAFETHLRAHGGGEVFVAPFDVILSDHTVVEPDVLFIADAQAEEILTEKHVRGAPALVIEVLSNARIDRVRKRDIYARFGVPEYWVVDPDADRVEVHRTAAGTTKPEVHASPTQLAFAPLPGFDLDLSALFAR